MLKNEGGRNLFIYDELLWGTCIRQFSIELVNPMKMRGEQMKMDKKRAEVMKKVMEILKAHLTFN